MYPYRLDTQWHSTSSKLPWQQQGNNNKKRAVKRIASESSGCNQDQGVFCIITLHSCGGPCSSWHFLASISSLFHRVPIFVSLSVRNGIWIVLSLFRKCQNLTAPPLANHESSGERAIFMCALAEPARYPKTVGATHSVYIRTDIGPPASTHEPRLIVYGRSISHIVFGRWEKEKAGDGGGGGWSIHNELLLYCICQADRSSI